jgi:DNA-binding response OmpR family regulator
MKILLLDDDNTLSEGTAAALHREGFTVLPVPDGHQALQRWHADQPDVVVLDVDLPGRSGWDICRQIRARARTPIILLGTQTADEQVVESYQAGADDYLEKPVRPRELCLRIRAVMRRVMVGRARPSQPEVRVASLGLVLDPETCQVHRDDCLIQLSPLQFRLLYQLAANAGKVVSTERLIVAGWGYDGRDTGAVSSHVSQIRKQLQLPRKGPGSLVAVPGVGYRLER